MKRYRSIGITLLLLGFISCKTEIQNFSFNQSNYDSGNFSLDYVRNGKSVFPLNESVAVEIPSIGYYSENNTRDNIYLPDKDIGGNIPIKIKICGEYKSGKYVCDSVIRYSSNKYIKKESSTFDFSNLDLPSLNFKGNLYRSSFSNIIAKYGSVDGSEQLELIKSNVSTTGYLDVNIKNSGIRKSIPLKVGEGAGYFSNLQNYASLKPLLKKEFGKSGKLNIEYKVRLNWGDQVYSFENGYQSIEANIITMNENYYHDHSLGTLDAAFYKYYNYGTELGVVTFKERDTSSPLQIEIYSDPEFSNLIDSSINSNVLFREYSNQYLYIKVINNSSLNTADRIDYRIHTHSVDYERIIEDASTKRLAIGIISILSGDDPDDIARGLDFWTAIFENKSLDESLVYFSEKELERQMSNILGGNFLTDIGVEAYSDLREEIYYWYSQSW